MRMDDFLTRDKTRGAMVAQYTARHTNPNDAVFAPRIVMTATHRHAMPLPLPQDHHDLRQRLVDAVLADDRAVGLIDYGSTSEGRSDRWSDVDSSLFIQPDDDRFVAEWND